MCAQVVERKELEREARKVEDSVRLDLPAAPASRVTVEIRAITVVKILAILFAVYLLSRVWSLIVLLALAVMLAAALAPLLALLEDRGVARPWALTIVSVSLVVVVLGLVALVIPGLATQTQQLIRHSPTYVAQLQKLLAEHGLHVPLRKDLKSLPSLIAKQNKLLVSLALSVFSGVVALVTVVIVTLYLLVDRERLSRFFVGMFPSDRRVGVLEVLAELRRQVGGYVRGQIITSVLATVFSGIVMAIAGVPNYLTLAVFVGLADFVPMFGGMIGTIPAVLIALTISPVRAAIVLGGFILYQQIENHYIVPRVYSSTLQMSPLTALVALLIGAKLLGIVGMLVALPLVAALPVMLGFAGIHLRTKDRLPASPDPAADIGMR